jgi:hypothetical protein
MNQQLHVLGAPGEGKPRQMHKISRDLFEVIRHFHSNLEPVDSSEAVKQRKPMWKIIQWKC